MPRIITALLKYYGRGFGLGLMPFMPGTWGTLPALPIAWLCPDELGMKVGLYLTLLPVAYLAADVLGKALGDSDHKSIVCDEIIGILPLLLWAGPQYWLASFLLFRLFDILKPWPISWIDNQVTGALGCLLDDLLAGLAAFCVVYLWMLSPYGS